MTLLKVGVFMALSMAAAQAQTYSQPMREVEKPGKTATAGFCQLVWGPSSPVSQSCELMRAPVDRILVVQHVSVYCTGRTGDAFAVARVSSRPPARNSGSVTYIPLQSAPTGDDAHQLARMGSTPLFQGVAADTALLFSAKFSGEATAGYPPYCNATFQGYFLPAVQ